MSESTGISEKWKNLAIAFVGNEQGKHCHWCKHIVTDDGSAECGNKASKFCDDDRIRSWDGEHCASECGLFELDDWYKSDANFDSLHSKSDTPTGNGG